MNIRTICYVKSGILQKKQNNKVLSKKQETETVLNNLYKSFEARERLLDAFHKKYF